MEKQLGRKVKNDYELTSISSWMEVPTEKKFTNQKVQAKNNQRMQPTIVKHFYGNQKYR